LKAVYFTKIFSSVVLNLFSRLQKGQIFVIYLNRTDHYQETKLLIIHCLNKDLFSHYTAIDIIDMFSSFDSVAPKR
jgi:hypothetical protein